MHTVNLLEVINMSNVLCLLIGLAIGLAYSLWKKKLKNGSIISIVGQPTFDIIELMLYVNN